MLLPKIKQGTWFAVLPLKTVGVFLPVKKEGSQINSPQSAVISFVMG